VLGQGQGLGEGQGQGQGQGQEPEPDSLDLFTEPQELHTTTAAAATTTTTPAYSKEASTSPCDSGTADEVVHTAHGHVYGLLREILLACASSGAFNLTDMSTLPLNRDMGMVEEMPHSPRSNVCVSRVRTPLGSNTTGTSGGYVCGLNTIRSTCGAVGSGSTSSSATYPSGTMLIDSSFSRAKAWLLVVKSSSSLCSCLCETIPTTTTTTTTTTSQFKGFMSLLCCDGKPLFEEAKSLRSSSGIGGGSGGGSGSAGLNASSSSKAAPAVAGSTRKRGSGSRLSNSPIKSTTGPHTINLLIPSSSSDQIPERSPALLLAMILAPCVQNDTRIALIKTLTSCIYDESFFKDFASVQHYCLVSPGFTKFDTGSSSSSSSSSSRGARGISLKSSQMLIKTPRSACFVLILSSILSHAKPLTTHSYTQTRSHAVPRGTPAACFNEAEYNSLMVACREISSRVCSGMSRMEVLRLQLVIVEFLVSMIESNGLPAIAACWGCSDLAFISSFCDSRRTHIDLTTLPDYGSGTEAAFFYQHTHFSFFASIVRAWTSTLVALDLASDAYNPNLHMYTRTLIQYVNALGKVLSLLSDMLDEPLDVTAERHELITALQSGLHRVANCKHVHSAVTSHKLVIANIIKELQSRDDN
jgi:hypothetical protein